MSKHDKKLARIDRTRKKAGIGAAVKKFGRDAVREMVREKNPALFNKFKKAGQ